ncbi:NAD(P)-binding protein [Stipitochalara longipes BDJ]|nr:NAD(P)-binding protein [Stipitochalara longipes BDJ]
MSNFNPATDIPDLSGKVCLVTGGNSGLGEAAVTALALHNSAKLYLAARSRKNADAAISRIRASSAAANSANIEFLHLDLSSFVSIKEAAARVNSEVERLDLLQLCAGIGMVPPDTTKEGYELQFGTNYLGHTLLTQLLMPKLLSTAARPNTDVRIVSISSVAHKMIAPKAGILFDELKTDMKGHGGAELYGQSKLADALLAYELGKRYPQITSVSVHPGAVKTGVWGGEKNVNWLLFNLVMKPLVAMRGVSPEEGVKTQLWCSFSKDVKSGSYYEKGGVAGKEGPLAHDDQLSEKLWKWTEKELKLHDAPGWEMK